METYSTQMCCVSAIIARRQCYRVVVRAALIFYMTWVVRTRTLVRINRCFVVRPVAPSVSFGVSQSVFVNTAAISANMFGVTAQLTSRLYNFRG